MIDTGCDREALVCSCYDEDYIFYDERLKNRYSDITEKEIRRIIDILIKEKILRGMYFLTVNWDKYKKGLYNIDFTEKIYTKFTRFEIMNI